MLSHFHSLINNQNYVCQEYDCNDLLVNKDPTPVKYGNMFLFDIPDGNYIDVVAYQRDIDLPHSNVKTSSMFVTLDGGESFSQNLVGPHVRTNNARIYKNEEYNAVVFSTHRGIPCIFAVPHVDFKNPVLEFEKRPATCGYSTMTLEEDEYEKELYHMKKMHELYTQVKNHFLAGNIPENVMRIIRPIMTSDINQ